MPAEFSMASSSAGAPPPAPVSLSTLGSGASAPATPPPPPKEAGLYDPTRDREQVRGQVALILTWCLVGVVAVLAVAGLVTSVVCMSGVACTPTTIELKTIGVLATIVLTPLVGLVGAVTGFYFGEKAGRADARGG
jgi:hypothetical protein